MALLLNKSDQNNFIIAQIFRNDNRALIVTISG